MAVGKDEKSKPLPFTRMSNLDIIRTDMVIMDNLYEEQSILILWGKVFKWITKKECPPQFASHNLHFFMRCLQMNCLWSCLQRGRWISRLNWLLGPSLPTRPWWRLGGEKVELIGGFSSLLLVVASLAFEFRVWLEFAMHGQVHVEVL